MDLSMFKNMLQNDAVSAGYGVVSSSLRKVASKLLGKNGVGQAGVNAVSVVAGMGLSQVNNPHVQIVGSALRISGLASTGNMVVEKLTSSLKPKTDSE